MSLTIPPPRVGKHVPCLLQHHIERTANPLYHFLHLDLLESDDTYYRVVTPGALFCVEGTVWTSNHTLKIDVEEWLTVLYETAAGLWVKRRRYRYHATIAQAWVPEEGTGNICRFDSPHRSIRDAASHHAHHHVHRYSMSSPERETIETLDEPETPTLEKFVGMIAARHAN